MSIQSKRAREKLVLSIHFTLYPGVDNNFIRFIQTTPRRNLARRVCEVIDAYLSIAHQNDPEKRSVEVSHE
ncbi:MAG: hypothetical protein CVU42_00105 [Chloroflexi bacterium HGW-Chloroflexi-4]|jgi:hypothetical protein|nr:MAG: hypothetical protein CVU42_00105 [Chloroflexi bacterium HGW-Chloroflexi-4]